MSQLKEAANLCRTWIKRVDPREPEKIVKLMDMGMLGMPICIEGQNESYLVALAVISEKLPCVSLKGGLSGIERLYKGTEKDIEVAENIVEVLNKLELICMIINEEEAKLAYPTAVRKFVNIKHLGYSKSIDSLVNLYK